MRVAALVVLVGCGGVVTVVSDDADPARDSATTDVIEADSALVDVGTSDAVDAAADTVLEAGSVCVIDKVSYECNAAYPWVWWSTPIVTVSCFSTDAGACPVGRGCMLFDAAVGLCE